MRQHNRADRNAWSCPNGHTDWDRRSTMILGKKVQFTCHVCKTVWNATADQRAAVLRFLVGTKRKA